MTVQPADLAQVVDPAAGGESVQKATESFFGSSIWLLVLIPVILAIALAAAKRRRTPELPHIDEGDWDEEVAQSPLPVVLHVYRPWCIGDRVIEAQIVKLAAAREGRLKVRWLDIEKNSGLRVRFPSLRDRSVVLFLEGRLIWERQGLHEFSDLLTEIEDALDLEEKRRAAQAPEAAND